MRWPIRRSIAPPAVVLALLAAACTAEFLVGEGTSTGTTAQAGPDDGGIISPGTSSGSPTTAGPGSTGGTTVGLEGSSTYGVTSHAESTGPGATTSGVAETMTDETGGFSPFADCFEHGKLGCEELPQCDLLDVTCWADPCHPAAPDACASLNFAECHEAPIGVCLWEGPEGRGVCAFSPCTELVFATCAEQPGCAWDGEPEGGTCVFLECPDCWELEADLCEVTEGCRWFPDPMRCAPDPV